MGREVRMLKYTDIQKVNAEISGIEVKGKSYAMVNRICTREGDFVLHQ